MSDRVVLAVITQDPVLKAAAERIKERHEHVKQRLEFMEKQVKNMIDEAKEADKPDEDAIEARLKETKALEPYNKETHHICIRHETNSIDLHKNVGHGVGGLLEFIKGIL